MSLTMAMLTPVTDSKEKTVGLCESITAVRAQIASAGKCRTKFAETMAVLLDVTAQLEELDEACRKAADVGQNEDAEVRKWRQVSETTMKFCKDNLIEQRNRAVEVLQDLSLRGASLVKESDEDSLNGKSGSIAMHKNSKLKAGAILLPPGLDYASKHMEVKRAPRNQSSKKTAAQPASWRTFAEMASKGATSQTPMFCIEAPLQVNENCSLNLDEYE